MIDHFISKIENMNEENKKILSENKNSKNNNIIEKKIKTERKNIIIKKDNINELNDNFLKISSRKIKLLNIKK